MPTTCKCQALTIPWQARPEIKLKRTDSLCSLPRLVTMLRMTMALLAVTVFCTVGILVLLRPRGAEGMCWPWQHRYSRKLRGLSFLLFVVLLGPRFEFPTLRAAWAAGKATASSFSLSWIVQSAASSLSGPTPSRRLTELDVSFHREGQQNLEHDGHLARRLAVPSPILKEVRSLKLQLWLRMISGPVLGVGLPRSRREGKSTKPRRPTLAGEGEVELAEPGRK